MTVTTSFLANIAPFLLATIGEFVGLHVWLVFLEKGEMLILANVILWLGFIFERYWVFQWLRNHKYYQINNIPLDRRLLLKWFFITVTEVFLWSVWYYSLPYLGMWGGAILLYTMMLLQHAVEVGYVKKEKLLTTIKSKPLHFFTLIETLAGVAWIVFFRDGQYMLASVCMLIGLSIEHIIEGYSLRGFSREKQK